MSHLIICVINQPRTVHRRGAKNRRGAVLILLALMLTAIIGLAALAIDGGNLYQERRVTQTVADAAAEAGAIELFNHYSTHAGVDSDGKARAAALASAEAHGYSGADVEINIPPLAGVFAGKAGYVEVSIKAEPIRGFSSIFGGADPQISSRSVGAGVMVDTVASVLVLDPLKKNSFKLNGAGSKLTVGGDIIINSKHRNAVQVSKNGQVTAENFVVSGGLNKNSRKFINAEVSTGAAPSPDPLSSLPIPEKGSNLNPNSFKSSSSGRDTYELVPGTYKQLKFDDDDIVYMEPGTYYVEEKFELKGSASVNASRVMIYNAGKKGFKIETNGTVHISPPTSGPYVGVSLFQGGTKKTQVEFKKQNQLDISGIIYAPHSEVKFKKSNVGFNDDDEDDDDEDQDWDQEEDSPMQEGVGVIENTSIGAAIIAAKISIAQNSQVTIHGSSIYGIRPLLGVVE
jgi:Putative Flp pilus-assembly TadE/G-like